MIHFDRLLWLQRFAEGGEGDGGTEGGTGVTSQEAAAPANKRARRENPLANVKFGIQPPEERAGQAAADNVDVAQTAEEETFESLINGKYKADYDANVQKIVRGRLKEQRGMEERLNSIQPILQIMGQRYGIDTSDPANIDVNALNKALSEDKALYEEEAARQGMPVDLYMQAQRIQRQQDAIDTQQRQIREQNEARAEYAQLLLQANEFKTANPQFNLDAEMQNPAFGRLVLKPPRGAGVPIANAYYAIHHDEITKAQRQQQMQVTQYAVQQTAQKVANSVASNSRRPIENGVSKTAASDPRTDPLKLTKAERAEIRRRVARGEKIYF